MENDTLTNHESGKKDLDLVRALCPALPPCCVETYEPLKNAFSWLIHCMPRKRRSAARIIKSKITKKTNKIKTFY